MQNLLKNNHSNCDTQNTGMVTDILEQEKGYIFIFIINAKETKVKTPEGNETCINGNAIIEVNGWDYDNTKESI